MSQARTLFVVSKVLTSLSGIFDYLLQYKLLSLEQSVLLIEITLWLNGGQPLPQNQFPYEMKFV